MQFKLQAAIDFLASYGMALIVLAIALAVIIKLAFLTPTLSTSTCTPAPGFACEFYAINTSGQLVITLVQAIGSPIVVKGLACSSLANTTGNKPMYGNIYVTNSIAYYPNGGSPNTGITLYSGEAYTFYVNCYNAGGIATGNLGNGYIGYLWINYTLQGYGQQTQQVASLALRYT